MEIFWTKQWSQITETELLNLAIDTFGPVHQLGKIVEEAGEFIASHQHYRDGRPGSKQKLIQELADLFIVIWQGRIILDATEVDRAIEEKKAKLFDEICKVKGWNHE